MNMIHLDGVDLEPWLFFLAFWQQARFWSLEIVYFELANIAFLAWSKNVQLLNDSCYFFESHGFKLRPELVYNYFVLSGFVIVGGLILGALLYLGNQS